ncbi:MAG: 30S ribosomal protein S16 [Flavobacteriaceae bacterium]|nr:MAG: 30S ribosomal protein S16 [Flavobacteriaceae bacterium]
MPARIRLQRHGRKAHAFYHIVVADARARRDGKFIEKLGIYNPNTSPSTIELNVDKALEWLHNGAEPTDTAKRLLSSKGVLMKKHLLDGVAKGAFNAEEAEKRFAKWLEDKNKAIEEKAAGAAKKKEEAKQAKIAAEKAAAAEKLAAELKAQKEAEEAAAKEAEEAAANAEPAAEESQEAASEETATEEASEETAAE